MKKRASIKELIEIARELRDTGGVAHGLFTKLRPKEVQDEMTDMTSELPAGVEIGQRMYHLREEMSEIPKCPVCEKDRAWYRYSNGYFETCGDKHCKQTVKAEKFKETVSSDEFAGKKKEWFDKQKQTMLERYGVDHNWKGDLRKTGEETMLERYGVKHALQGEEAQEKRRRTTEERHGTLDMFSLGRETVKEKYGVENAMQNEEVKEKFTKSMKKAKNDIASDKLKNHSIEMIGDSVDPYHLHCGDCDTCFKSSNATVNINLRRGESPCPRCNPPDLSSSRGEKELKEFISLIYAGDIRSNDRYVMRGTQFMEVDIHVPSKKIAFEYNGLYWHSDEYIKKTYHKRKTEVLNEKGVRLVHIWEDDWLGKKEIIKSRISSLLGLSKKIYARECKLVNVSGSDYRKFCEKNHIQGYTPASVIIGLEKTGELVSIMSFGKPRKMKSEAEKNTWEIIRMCSSLNTVIIGGANKMFNEFVSRYEFESIISFCDASFSPDPLNTVYTKLGMSHEKTTDPNFLWVVGRKRFNRISWTKKRLVSMGYDPSWSESKIMESLGHRKIWDCGQHKFIFRK